uniref:Uncharacterized protein n=1 Tax=Lepeophtheirus salmonis TaxID=72036 RepID=A0A0K2TUJ2_LEPSM
MVFFFLGSLISLIWKNVNKADNKTITNFAVKSISNVLGSDFRGERLKGLLPTELHIVLKQPKTLNNIFQLCCVLLV